MSKMLFSFLLVIFLTGCGKKQELLRNDNIAIVKSMFDAFNRHDWKAMADHYADSASFLDPSFGKEYVTQSKTDLAKKYEEMQKFLPDIHDEIIGLYPSGDKVGVEFVSTGTLPDGSRFTLPVSCILTLENGKIIKDATYYDLDDQ